MKEEIDGISRVEFQKDKAKINSGTLKILTDQKGTNDSSMADPIVFTFNETVTETSTFTRQAGVEISAGTEFKCGLPFVADGKVDVSVKASRSITWGKETSIAQGITDTVTVNIAPYTVVTCEAKLTEMLLEVPYVIHFESGKTSCGMWSGASNWNFESKVHEEKIKGHQKKRFKRSIRKLLCC